MMMFGVSTKPKVRVNGDVFGEREAKGSSEDQL